MNAQQRKAGHMQLVRNVLLVAFALGGLAFFFTLDLFEESRQGGLFGPKLSNRIHFKGQLKSNEFSDDQLRQFSNFFAKYEKVLERVDIFVSKDDSYSALQPDTQVLFEIRMVLVSGARLETPVRRTTWGQLVEQASRKIDKDLRAYASMHGGRLPAKGGSILVNSM